MTVAYNKDPSPNKLNLGVGAYRTEVFLSFFKNHLNNKVDQSSSSTT